MDNEFEFSKITDAFNEKYRYEVNILLAQKDKILNELAEKGMHQDVEHPYAYYIPLDASFDCGRGKDCPMRSIYAIVLMARASYSSAGFLDCDKEGFPELPQFCGGEEGFHRVYITDPFAQLIDRAIMDYQENMVKKGKARFVNGKFYKVA